MGDGRQPSGEGVQIEQGHERQADDEAVFPELALGKAWGESITNGRAAELEAKLQAWEQEADHGDRKGPFDVSELPWTSEERDPQRLTGADVFWLAGRALVDTSAVPSLAAAVGRLLRAPDDPEVRLDLNLSALNLSGADLQGANLSGADLEGADLSRAILGDAHLSRACLWGADLAHAVVEFANLSETRLDGANLSGADLEGANLSGATLGYANLSGANLTRATFDNRTILIGVNLTDTPHVYSAFLLRIRRERIEGPVSLADLHWNDVDLTVVDWSGLHRLGDELGDERGKQWWRRWWRTRAESERATRANVQLAKRLRDAGMNDDADRFAYRAQVCQRGVHLLRGHILRWLFSWLLFVIAGYGYRPLRTLFWYLAVIGSFAFAFYLATHGMLTFGLAPSQVKPPFHWYEALVLSVSSFHGRGFFQPVQSLGDPVAILAAAEAVFGLFIEISFIATFTQRYFGK